MKYVVTWRERPTASAAEYEAAQTRVREAFSRGRLPRSLTFHRFVARVGLGGYAVVETDEPADLQYLATAYEPASFTVEPVVDGLDAVVAQARGVG
ncbi:DUF3303 domain-containing protein [Geodermatophilus sp. URMC 61]|uniref:DUF3303 domain-containing protein n=1 Tax=Geodermatophilus sp. URMC 61 TaxID=3423411 RepID=UPI00406BF5CE